MRVRFAITQTTNAGEQWITSAASLATGWHHIAVVLDVGATYTGTICIDSTMAERNPAMTLRPSNLGNTAEQRHRQVVLHCGSVLRRLGRRLPHLQPPARRPEIAALYSGSGDASTGGQGGSSAGTAGTGGASGGGGTAGGTTLDVRIKGEAGQQVQWLTTAYQVINNGSILLSRTDFPPSVIGTRPTQPRWLKPLPVRTP